RCRSGLPSPCSFRAGTPRARRAAAARRGESSARVASVKLLREGAERHACRAAATKRAACFLRGLPAIVLDRRSRLRSERKAARGRCEPAANAGVGSERSELVANDRRRATRLAVPKDRPEPASRDQTRDRLRLVVADGSVRRDDVYAAAISVPADLKCN